MKTCGTLQRSQSCSRKKGEILLYFVCDGMKGFAKGYEGGTNE